MSSIINAIRRFVAEKSGGRMVEVAIMLALAAALAAGVVNIVGRKVNR